MTEAGLIDSLLSDGQGGELKDSAFAFARQRTVIVGLIRELGLRSVCEIGGGRNPLLSSQDAQELGVDYTVLDISAKELALAPAEFKKIVCDICASSDVPGESFDFMFSRMVAEHVRSGAALHRNVFRLLRPGGYAFHFMPTLYTPAFVVNRLMPESLTHWMLRHVSQDEHEKFPAIYSWCRGPTRRSVERLQKLGYDVIEYRPFYGTGYLAGVPFASSLERGFNALAARCNSRLFCSYCLLLLRRPAAGREPGARFAQSDAVPASRPATAAIR